MTSRRPFLRAPSSAVLLRGEPAMTSWRGSSCCRGKRQGMCRSCSRLSPSSFLLCGLKQEFDVTAQMIDAGGGDLGAVLRFGQNKGSLQDCLGMNRETLRGPPGADAALAHRLGDIRVERGSVIEDARAAGIADGRVRCECFLHHRADQTGELGHIAFQELLAEIDIAEHAVERIGVPVIGRRRKQLAGHLRPMVCGRSAKIFLALEVMEKGALCHTGSRAKIIDGCCRIALFTHHVERGIQKTGAGVDRLRHYEPYRPVGMLSRLPRCARYGSAR